MGRWLYWLMIVVCVVSCHCVADTMSQGSDGGNEQSKANEDITSISTTAVEAVVVNSVAPVVPASEPSTVASKIEEPNPTKEVGECKGDDGLPQRTSEGSDLVRASSSAPELEKQRLVATGQFSSSSQGGSEKKGKTDAVKDDSPKPEENDERKVMNTVSERQHTQTDLQQTTSEELEAMYRSTTALGARHSETPESHSSKSLEGSSKTNRRTVPVPLSTSDTRSMPTRSEPSTVIRDSIQINRNDATSSLKGISATIDSKPPGTLLPDLSKTQTPIRDPKKAEEEMKTTKTKLKAPISNGASHPTISENKEKISHDISGTTALAPGAKMTTVDTKGTVSKVDSTTTATEMAENMPSPELHKVTLTEPTTPLPNVSNALPLHHSVDKTDFSLGSSSLFALAALATLAVAAAAPAH